jgi:hypothetical protein
LCNLYFLFRKFDNSRRNLVHNSGRTYIFNFGISAGISDFRISDLAGITDYGFRILANLKYFSFRAILKREDDDFDYLYGIVITTVRDWHFLLYSLGKIFQASELPLAIKFNKKAKALVKDSEKYKTLHSGVKKVLDMVVGMLIDRVSAKDESSSKKKARVEEYRSKK